MFCNFYYIIYYILEEDYYLYQLSAFSLPQYNKSIRSLLI